MSHPVRFRLPLMDPLEGSRRAISSAYYALFHALAASNADALIGAPQDRITAAAWSRVYRGLDHGTARRELQRHRQEFSAGSQIFADTFHNLQYRRHSADYDHNAVFTGQQATVWLAEAEVAIVDYMQDTGAYCPFGSMVREPYDGIIGDAPIGAIPLGRVAPANRWVGKPGAAPVLAA